MSDMAKSWQVKSLATEKLSNLPEIPAVIVRLLALRGLTDPDQIQDFLNPDYSRLHDPFRFQDMQKATARIQRAIDAKEKITIYADYDADAITACATVFLALKKLGATPEYYIPDRFAEGYGMNEEAIRKIAATGATLIITVDCGTNAIREAELCHELGVDLIITDHHELTGPLPQAFALINPKNPQDQYPFGYLTGVGVAFKLVQALFSASPAAGWEKWLLDLVAIGTVADCQSLTGENRILVSFGLKVLPKTLWPGLKAMLPKAGADRFDTFTLGFIIAPRINAAGRIKHANIAMELLIEPDSTRAGILAAELDELNRHRQMLTEQIMSEAKSQIELLTDKKILLTFGHDWPKGIVGLVAGRLAEQYNRPVLAVSTTPEGLATGSARSTASFDIVKALGHAKDLLTKYGGHTQAAGFSLETKNLEDFHIKLLEYAEQVNFALAEPTIEADAEVEPGDISWSVLEYLEKMGPFGYGNPKPKLIGRQLEVVEARTVGAQSQHLKLKVRYGEHTLEAIAFNQGFLLPQMQVGRKIDTMFELTANVWNGRQDMQLKVLDIKLHE